VKLVAFVDGAARGNPGPAGAGAFFPSTGDQNGPLELFVSLGRATNNEAEYHGLLLALRGAQEKGATDLSVFADSLLLVEQLNGRFRVKAENLKTLFAEALRRAKSFRSFSISHVRREKNKEADRLANLGADASQGHSAARPKER